MTYYRHVYRNAPATVPLPPELHDRRVEVIVLPLDEAAANGEQRAVDGSGGPQDSLKKPLAQCPTIPNAFPRAATTTASRSNDLFA